MRSPLPSLFSRARVSAAVAALASSCAELGGPGDVAAVDPAFYNPERDRGLEELAAPLTQLATPCTFAAISGVNTATVTIADGETAVMSRRSVDSAILVNGVQCGTATATTLKRIVATGTTGTNTLILDFMNGSFAPGYGSTVGVAVDLVSGSNDAVKIRGSTGADTITVGTDGISFNTDTVRDISVANTDAITVSMGTGNDVFSASGGYGTGTPYTTAITAYGGEGNDTLSGGAAADSIHGGAGNDTIRGATDAALDTAADSLYGDAGDDTFDCGNASNGGDRLDGGDGTDTASYALRTVAISVTVDQGAPNDGAAGEADDVVASVENVTGGSADDTIIGDAYANVLSGGLGDDTLAGGAGADTLNGGAGDDVLDAGSVDEDADIFIGGAGSDTVTYGARASDLVITIDGAANDGAPGENDNVKTDVEVVLGGGGVDNITGSASANILTGGPGDDVLYGGAGDDVFDEGTFNSGADTFNGGAGTDTVDYSGRIGVLTVTMDGVDADDGLVGESDDVKSDVEGLFGGTGADTITGNAGNNVINGGGGADIIDGGAGADELFGGAGVDQLTGGAGDDLLDGGGATDTPLDCGDGDGDIVISGPGETPAACEL